MMRLTTRLASSIRKCVSQGSFTEAHDFFVPLPDEVLLLCLDSLDDLSLLRSAGVCKRWRNLLLREDKFQDTQKSKRKMKAFLRLVGQTVPSEQLVIKNWPLADTHSAELGLLIQLIPNLRSLELSSNEIGVAGASAIGQALQHNSTVVHLNLHGNSIGSGGATAIAQALTTNTTLEYLDLSWNLIRVEGLKAIADAMCVNRSVKTLLLGGNVVIVEGALAIQRALEQNSTLTHLDLPFSWLRYDGTVAIAEGLRTNTALRRLNLACNDIDSAGARYLGKVLEDNNRTLTAIDLSINNVGDQGALAMASTLRSNRSLAELNLRMTWISKRGAEFIADALNVGDTLQLVRMQHLPVAANGCSVETHRVQYVGGLHGPATTSSSCAHAHHHRDETADSGAVLSAISSVLQYARIR